MAENAQVPVAADDDASRESARSHLQSSSAVPWRWQAAALALALLAGVACMRPMSIRRAQFSDWLTYGAFAAAALAAAAWAARRAMKRPPPPPPMELNGLANLLPRLRNGDEPIESLSPFTQTICAPLVSPLRDLLHDLRLQRTAVAELEAEVRQRIANRTDALERALSSMRYQATRDALTGLFNRRFLDQYLPQAVQRHLKEKWDMALLMIDVDNFKLLNDGFGHAAGDELLRSIGQIIRSSVRGEDVSFRVGGDEFIILLPNADTNVAADIAQRLTSLVDALAKTLRATAPPRLSIGVSSLSLAAATTPQELLDHADRALYQVKDSRKDARPGRGPVGATR